MSTHQDLPCSFPWKPFIGPQISLSRVSAFLCPSCLLVGPSGLEPPTLRLSGARSSQLSYGPIFRTRTTSIQEMTFSLASMPCTNFYVFCVRTDFWFSRPYRVQLSYVFCLRTDFYDARVHAMCKFLASGGGEGIRTPDPLLAGQVLSQLSYTPVPLSAGGSAFSFERHRKPNNRSLCS